MEVATAALGKLGKLRTFVGYFIMLAVAAGVFYVVNKHGSMLSAPPPAAGSLTTVAAKQQINALLHVLLALSVVIITAQAMGAFFKLFGQPPVIGEVIGGILLGPSFLGRLAPHVAETILPPFAAPFLSIIANLGIILYMFLVGLELDLKVLRKSGHATLAISHASIILPFILGTGLAVYLYPELSTSDVRFTVFALFIGVSMSITAFPVLARILTDRQIQKTRMGTVALTCAAIDDVSAWCLLALVVSVAQAKIGGALITMGLTVAYIAFMFIVVRPLIARAVPLLETFDRLTQGGMAAVVVVLLLSSLSTELIGIHAIFGAFLLGAVTPHNSRVAKELTDRLEDLVSVLFLPAFFAFTGMRTQIGLLTTGHEWVLTGVIIVIASVGKFGGTLIAARLTGLNWRNSAGLGILMNTRGLVELIVLNIGLDLKVISPTLFAMLVFMALVTTFLTTPVLSFLLRNHPWTTEA